MCPYRESNEGRDLWTLGRGYLHTLRLAVEAKGLEWFMAHTTADLPLPTEIVFEWWYKDRNVTVFYRRAEVEAIRVWGPNIHTEMESTWLCKPEDFVPVYRWLQTGETR